MQVLARAEHILRTRTTIRRATYGLAFLMLLICMYSMYVQTLDPQALLLEMAECNERVLGEQKVQAWLDGGPLLGALRHGGFLPSDDSGDFDLGLNEEDVPAVFALIPRLRAECGHIIHRSETNYWPGVLDTLFHIHRAAFRQFAGKYTPVFLDYKDYELDSAATDQDGETLPMMADLHFVGSEDAIAFPYDAVYPLWDCPFEHTSFKCPNDAEAILRATYGDDWCIPASTHTSELSETQRGVKYYEDALRAYLSPSSHSYPSSLSKPHSPSPDSPCPTRQDRLDNGLFYKTTTKHNNL